jgi:hypothetical protein
MVNEQLDSNIDWPIQNPIGRKADQLEEDLHCPICTDFFDNPHLLITCGHSFCSLCIRKHFDAKLNTINSGTCPICRKKGQTNDLCKNVALAAVVERYQALRGDFFALLCATRATTATTNNSNSVNNSNSSSGNIVRMSQRSLRRVSGPPVRSGEPIVARLAQFNPHGIKVDRLRQHMSEITAKSSVELRMDGDRGILERRLRELTHQINAQVGADHPLSLDDVIAKVNLAETHLEMELRKSLRGIGVLKVCLVIVTM